MTSELQPCPFCGGNAYVTHGYCSNHATWPGDFWRVFCGSCQARQLFHVSDADAVAAWNRRPLQSHGRDVPTGQSCTSEAPLADAQTGARLDALSDAQCDAIFDALHNWAMDIDQYEFGLPQASGGGKEGGREVIRKALRAASAPTGEGKTK